MFPIHEQDGGFLVPCHPEQSMDIQRVWERYYKKKADEILSKYFERINSQPEIPPNYDCYARFFCILLSRAQPRLKGTMAYDIEDCFHFPLEKKRVIEYGGILYAMCLHSKMCYKFKVSVYHISLIYLFYFYSLP